jgi:hypothetical protein
MHASTVVVVLSAANSVLRSLCQAAHFVFGLGHFDKDTLKDANVAGAWKSPEKAELSAFTLRIFSTCASCSPARSLSGLSFDLLSRHHELPKQPSLDDAP